MWRLILHGTTVKYILPSSRYQEFRNQKVMCVMNVSQTLVEDQMSFCGLNMTQSPDCFLSRFDQRRFVLWQLSVWMYPLLSYVKRLVGLLNWTIPMFVQVLTALPYAYAYNGSIFAQCCVLPTVDRGHTPHQDLPLGITSGLKKGEIDSLI